MLTVLVIDGHKSETIVHGVAKDVSMVAAVGAATPVHAGMLPFSASRFVATQMLAPISSIEYVVTHQRRRVVVVGHVAEPTWPLRVHPYRVSGIFLANHRTGIAAIDIQIAAESFRITVTDIQPTVHHASHTDRG